MSLRFYDSNIILYAYSRTPGEERKRDIARQCLAANNWCISAQVLQEFYTNAIRVRPGIVTMMDASKATEVVAFIELQVRTAVDAALVQRAIQISQRNQISYWDAAIIAAAARCGADELLSEDMNGGQTIEGVRVVNPFA
jgi:predicted nucleic acid-binding protein